MPYPIRQGAEGIDLSKRVLSSSTVAASPAAAAETVVATVTGIDANLPVMVGVFLSGVVSFTVGTAGTAIRVRIRTGVTAGAGTVVADTGAVTGGVSATGLISQDIQGFDTTSQNGAAPGTTSYCITLQVTSASAASTVSATNLTAIVA
jgi:hypothetical protein